MKEIKFVNANSLSCLEEYGASLLTGLYSLKTLEAFHLSAFNKGLLDEDEAETGKTICWEIHRLMALYKTQIENVLDRTNLKEEDILSSLKSMVPEIKIPKRKYTRRKAKNANE